MLDSRRLWKRKCETCGHEYGRWKGAADLITLEVLPNEGATVGDIYDTDDKSFCGCFNGPYGEQQEQQMDEMIRNHKDVLFVAAHPGEKTEFLRHLKRMEISENYHLDLSGTGLFRHGLLRHGIDEFGASRFLYGSDYPICNPGTFIGGVMYDFLLSETEKEQIFYKNAVNILKLD